MFLLDSNGIKLRANGMRKRISYSCFRQDLSDLSYYALIAQTQHFFILVLRYYYFKFLLIFWLVILIFSIFISV